MFTRAFLKDAAERVLRTFAQAWVGLLIGVQGGLLHVDWVGTLSVAGLVALMSLLNYVVASPAQASPVVPPATKPAGR